jgi:hypothetical protein
MTKMAGEFMTRTDEEQSLNDRLFQVYTDLLPKLGPNWHRHSLVGLKVEALARTLYYAELYKKIVDVPGVICEFGVQWGATLVELINLRSILEPFNHSRTIVGFDTFEGFPAVTAEDGHSLNVGDYKSTDRYMETLSEILQLHEAAAPMAQYKKHELVKGDVSETFEIWLEDNPHAIISMAIFDMDLYKPTLDALNLIKPRLTKGALLVFDEVNCKHVPGETVALREAIGTENLSLRKTPSQPFCSWAVWGE